MAAGAVAREDAMSIKSRALALGGAAVLAASLAVVAVQVSGGTPQASGTTKSTILKARDDGSSQFQPFTIWSPDFTQDGWLPVSAEGGPYSETGCSGDNIPPTLKWYNVPSGTESFAFVITDVDAPVAGNFHHWLVYNIPTNVTALGPSNDTDYSQGTNDYGFVGYGGPCPPADGQTHHYIFTVYALDTTSVPGTDLDYSQLMTAISPYVVGATSTIGKFVLPLGS
jgi:Raf kinase inhibitor-like YbhB/YbcL family protein